MKISARTLAEMPRLAGQLAAADEQGAAMTAAPAPAGFSFRISYTRNPATTLAQTRVAKGAWQKPGLNRRPAVCKAFQIARSPRYTPPAQLTACCGTSIAEFTGPGRCFSCGILVSACPGRGLSAAAGAAEASEDRLRAPPCQRAIA